MVTVTAQAVVNTGLEATYAAAAVGLEDKVLAGGNTFLHVKNGGGSPITVTLSTPATFDSLAVADPVSTVDNAKEEFIGPLPRSTFGDPADGNLVTITWSDNTSVTFAAIYLP